MTEQREYAARTSIHAFYSHSQLLIVAEGELPSPEYEIDISQVTGELIPTFQLTRRPRAGATDAPSKATPFRYGEIFSIGRPPEVIRVKHAGGIDDVTVEFTREDLVDIVLSLSGGDVEVGLPDTEGEAPAVPPPPPPPTFEAPGGAAPELRPLESRPLTASEKAGILSDIAVRYRESVGYSNKLSFDEAFQDALRKLPPASVKFPDMLETVEVVHIGASFGGIAGFHRLEVRIRAYPD